jgi:ornithine carbamoyltransferase
MSQSASPSPLASHDAGAPHLSRALVTKDLLQVADLASHEVVQLIALARIIKRKPQSFADAFRQRTLVMLFEKPSLRTRVSFEAGFQRLGGGVSFLDHQATPLGARESVEDYAHTLERYADAIVARVRSHAMLSRLAECAAVPVINALSDAHHPCQALADMLTLVERGFDPVHGHLAWIGDGNNVCHSLIEAVAALGGRITVITPVSRAPDPDVMRGAQGRAFRTGARIDVAHDPAAAEGAHAIYTDTWVSMGDEADAERQRALLAPFRVDAALMRRAAPGAWFMHCLPAHRGEEVTDEVIDSAASLVFDQAENRMHAQNALLLALLRPDLARAALAP